MRVDKRFEKCKQLRNHELKVWGSLLHNNQNYCKWAYKRKFTTTVMSEDANYPRHIMAFK